MIESADAESDAPDGEADNPHSRCDIKEVAISDDDMFQFDGTEEVVSSASPSDDEDKVRGSSSAEPPKKLSRVTRRGS